MNTTDLDVLERFCEVVGGRLFGPYQRKDSPTNKPFWVWRASSRDDQHRVVCLLRPYLGERRRAQADRFLAAKGEYAAMHRLEIGGTCRFGHELTEETLYVSPRGAKHCKVCRREYGREAAAARRAGHPVPPLAGR